MRIGIDIGGTKTEAVALGADGAVVAQARLDTARGPAGVIGTALEALRRLGGAATDLRGAESIGVGIPGLVDSEHGVVEYAFNLGLERLDLATALRERTGVPVRVENDVKAAALGATHLLGIEGSMAFLNLGTGLAAGLVTDGRILRGAQGIAGEIGHVSVDPAGIACPCGQRGCLETVASGSGLARQWPSRDPLPAAELFRAAADGDPLAAEVRDRLVHGTAQAVRLLVLTVDPGTVVVGGGLRHLGAPLFDRVRDEFTALGARSAFFASLGLAERLRVLPDGLAAAAVGTALIGQAPTPAPTS